MMRSLYLLLALLVIMAGCSDGTTGDDDATLGDDDATHQGEGDDDATHGGDDDASQGDDDASQGDDDASQGDDDASQGDDDASGDVDADGDGYSIAGGDCDDSDSAVHPDATELCNSKDDNCDTQIDEGVTAAFYPDVDQDGYGAQDGTSVQACDAPAGYAADHSDCNDADAQTYPGAPESCNDTVDYNCDGSSGLTDQDNDGAPACQDCNDADGTVYPGALEACNGVDDNCDDQIDEGLPTETWYPDSDADGYGSASNPQTSCSQPTGYVSDDTDCDDNNAAVNAGASESCNGIDDNCNSQIDDGVQNSYYVDADSDGFGQSGSEPVLACTAPSGYVADNTDCNDADPKFNPGATESCTDTVDYNCDGSTSYADADSDGVPACQDCNDQDANAYPGAKETCNAKDDDCNGQIDDGVPTSTWYADTDGDAYGNPDNTTVSCAPPAGYVSDKTDCDDSKASVNPGAAETCNSTDDNCNGQTDEGIQSTFYQDADGDGFGNSSKPVTACSAPTGYVATGSDCDDSKASIYPGAQEVCNGIDENCDGQIDNGLSTATYYQDADGDGFGNAAKTSTSCAQPAGYVTDKSDCDDTNKAINPTAAEVCNAIDDDCDGKIDDADDNVTGQTKYYQDADGDGYGGSSVSVSSCSKPSGYVTSSSDCDDTNKKIYPGAIESCNGLDDNCNGQIDDGVATSTFYQDADGDGYGNPAKTTTACAAPTGYVADKTDCDDTKASVHPGAVEQCNSVDDNCNGQIDDGVVSSTWYKDADGDGYGISSSTTTACAQPSGYAAVSGDCDDANKNVHPGQTETCNGLDDNCSGQIDEGVTSSFYADTDKDGYGNAAATTQGCSAPAGYVADKTDCDDTNAAIHPGATETCNSVDDNCNGQVDEGVQSTFYQDADSDGYGNAAKPSSACTAPSGYVKDASDCDDANGSVHPGATETCNSVDDNCNGSIDEGVTTSYYVDADQDGYGNASGQATAACSQPTGYVTDKTDCDDSNKSVHPGATELCDGLDNDCDGTKDEGLTANYYRDADGDGFGNSADATCALAGGYIASRGDCNDTNAGIHPGATDNIGNGVDEDCGGKDGGQPHVGYYNSPYTSIQAAINAAASGAIIWIGPRTYSEHNLTFKGKAITVISSHFATKTVIDAQKSGNGFLFNTSETSASILDGFTVTNASASGNGGGLYIAAASPTIQNCTISASTATNNGAGVFVLNGNPTLTSDTISGNKASNYGGGIFLNGSNPLMTSCTLTGNSADLGGGLYGTGAVPTLNKCTISKNTAASGGGGMRLISSSNAIVVSSSISSNTSFGSGGGLWVDGSNPKFQFSTFDFNGAVYDGGATFVTGGATAQFTNCIFSDNFAEDFGGAIAIDASNPLFTNCFIDHNECQVVAGSYGTGGGVLFNNSNAKFTNCLITDNIADVDGGGVYVQSTSNSTPTLLNCVIANNRLSAAYNGRGGGLYVFGSTSSPIVRNSILAYNDNYNIYANVISSASLYMGYDDVYAASGNNTNLSGLGPGSVTVEPKFLSYSNSIPTDFHLSTSSPLVNKGDGTIKDADSSVSDMGIYGGPSGDDFDLDNDGYSDYFWPGDLSAPPTGYKASNYDCDDLDPTLHLCP